jgi:hypothetical protein
LSERRPTLRTRWGDRGHINVRGNNIEMNFSAVALMVKGMFALRKPTLYDLFTLHALARGDLIEEEEDADLVFSVEKESQFDFENIIGNYL